MDGRTSGAEPVKWSWPPRNREAAKIRRSGRSRRACASAQPRRLSTWRGDTRVWERASDSDAHVGWPSGGARMRPGQPNAISVPARRAAISVPAPLCPAPHPTAPHRAGTGSFAGAADGVSCSSRDIGGEVRSAAARPRRPSAKPSRASGWWCSLPAAADRPSSMLTWRRGALCVPPCWRPAPSCRCLQTERAGPHHIGLSTITRHEHWHALLPAIQPAAGQAQGSVFSALCAHSQASSTAGGSAASESSGGSDHWRNPSGVVLPRRIASGVVLASLLDEPCGEHAAPLWLEAEEAMAGEAGWIGGVSVTTGSLGDVSPVCERARPRPCTGPSLGLSFDACASDTR